MEKATIARVLILILFVVIMNSCDNLPTAEMESATAAVGRAEAEADVRTYAADSLSKAKELLSRMNAEAEANQYDSARTLAEEAGAAAEKAIRDATTAKTRAREGAAAALNAAKLLLSETKRALDAAQDVRGIGLDIDGTDRELDEIENTISSAESDMSRSDFSAAQTKAEGARSSIAIIQRRISEATQAVSRKK